ncbi:MAG: hypothetical protein ACRD5L_04890, partial [Bryobacteraceae bacterium]
MTPYATPQDTLAYSQRFAERTSTDHFRRIPDPFSPRGAETLHLSSLGMGTYLGEPDEATDRAYTETAIAAVESGFNVLDSAINYRLQRSERSLGAALAELERRGFPREQ